jgi:hypothetical protein
MSQMHSLNILIRYGCFHIQASWLRLTAFVLMPREPLQELSKLFRGWHEMRSMLHNKIEIYFVHVDAVQLFLDDNQTAITMIDGNTCTLRLRGGAGGAKFDYSQFIKPPPQDKDYDRILTNYISKMQGDDRTNLELIVEMCKKKNIHTRDICKTLGISLEADESPSPEKVPHATATKVSANEDKKVVLKEVPSAAPVPAITTIEATPVDPPKPLQPAQAPATLITPDKPTESHILEVKTPTPDESTEVEDPTPAVVAEPSRYDQIKAILAEKVRKRTPNPLPISDPVPAVVPEDDLHAFYVDSTEKIVAPYNADLAGSRGRLGERYVHSEKEVVDVASVTKKAVVIEIKPPVVVSSTKKVVPVAAPKKAVIESRPPVVVSLSKQTVPEAAHKKAAVIENKPPNVVGSSKKTVTEIGPEKAVVIDSKPPVVVSSVVSSSSSKKIGAKVAIVPVSSPEKSAAEIKTTKIVPVESPKKVAAEVAPKNAVTGLQADKPTPIKIDDSALEEKGSKEKKGTDINKFSKQPKTVECTPFEISDEEMEFASAGIEHLI